MKLCFTSKFNINVTGLWGYIHKSQDISFAVLVCLGCVTDPLIAHALWAWDIGSFTSNQQRDQIYLKHHLKITLDLFVLKVMHTDIPNTYSSKKRWYNRFFSSANNLGLLTESLPNTHNTVVSETVYTRPQAFMSDTLLNSLFYFRE